MIIKDIWDSKRLTIAITVKDEVGKNETQLQVSQKLQSRISSPNLRLIRQMATR